MERRSRWLLLRGAVALALCLGQPLPVLAILQPGDGGGTTNPPPQITCPGDIMVNNDPGQCGASVSFSVTATGSPAPAVAYKIGETPITSPHVFPVGTTTVTATATNTGGSVSCSFTVTVPDVEPPQISCGASVQAYCQPGESSATLNVPPPIVTDNCGGVTYHGNRSDGKALTDPYSACEPVTNIIWTAIDAVGNTNVCLQSVVLRDPEPPHVVCPRDITVTSPICDATVAPGQPTVTDACIFFTLSAVRSDGRALTDSYPSGTTTITHTATNNASGASSNCTQTITVIGPRPLIASLGGITVNTDPGQCSAVVADSALAQLSASNCADFVVTRSGIPPGNVFPLGNTIVTSTITDSFGQSSSCSATVTVVDAEPPHFTNGAPVGTTALATCVPGGIGAVVNFAPLSATDNCGPASVSYSHPSGAFFPPGTTEVIATATDPAGNKATCPIYVTVAYSWSGVLQPINPDGTSIFKLGSTVPVKFALTGASQCLDGGNFKLYLTKLSSAASGTEVEAVSTSAADSGNTFRYSGGQYQFNLSTKGLTAGLWQLRIDLGDGSTNLVQFSLKK
jgi:hypothetical protein